MPNFILIRLPPDLEDLLVVLCVSRTSKCAGEATEKQFITPCKPASSVGSLSRIEDATTSPDNTGCDVLAWL